MLLKTEFNAERRDDIGKGASRRLRRRGLIPAVVYGKGVEPLAITVSHDEFNNAQSFDAFYTSNLTISVDGKPFTVKIQDMQRHVYKPKLIHLDFKLV